MNRQGVRMLPLMEATTLRFSTDLCRYLSLSISLSTPSPFLSFLLSVFAATVYPPYIIIISYNAAHPLPPTLYLFSLSSIETTFVFLPLSSPPNTSLSFSFFLSFYLTSSSISSPPPPTSSNSLTFFLWIIFSPILLFISV